METILEKIKKIKVLADEGFAGEAENAKRMLAAMVQKYGINLADLEVVETRDYRFKYSTKHDKQLIVQTIFNTIPDRALYRSSSGKALIIALTNLEFVEIKTKLDFHQRQYKKERDKAMKTLFSAYIHKHNLYFMRPGGASEKKLSFEEAMAILAAADNMENVTYHKQLKK